MSDNDSLTFLWRSEDSLQIKMSRKIFYLVLVSGDLKMTGKDMTAFPELYTEYIELTFLERSTSDHQERTRMTSMFLIYKTDHWRIQRGRGGAPPPPKIFEDQGSRGYTCIYMYIMTNVHISRSILKSQLFTCLSLAILFLSFRLCSVAVIFRGG